MFVRLLDDEPDVAVTVDGLALHAYANETVAALLLRTGRLVFGQSPADQVPRGPYCMMGACFQCLVTIDGLRNQRACVSTVRPGMTISRGRDHD